MRSAIALLPAADSGDLRRHLQQCADTSRRFDRLHNAVDALDQFVAPRFITTLGALTLLMLMALAFLP